MSKMFQVHGIWDNYWFGKLAKIVLNTVKIYEPWGRRNEIFVEHV